MKRPPNDAWHDKQKCGPLFVYFTVNDYEDEGFKIEWCVCPDDEDKSDERVLACDQGDIRGPKEMLDGLIDRAMKEAQESVTGIARNLLIWAWT